MTDCNCPSVVIYEPGVWKCRICRKQFIPLSDIEVIEQGVAEPLPVEKPIKED